MTYICFSYLSVDGVPLCFIFQIACGAFLCVTELEEFFPHRPEGSDDYKSVDNKIYILCLLYAYSTD